jgi:hypothetical protein
LYEIKEDGLFLPTPIFFKHYYVTATIKTAATVINDNTPMIIDFTVFCKNYNEKIYDFKGVFCYACPACKAKCRWIRHGKYTRHLILLSDSTGPVEESLSILRLKCKSCKCTHAILPRECVPYLVFGTLAILTVLSDYHQERSPKKISEKHSISWQALYLMLDRFVNSLNSLMVALRENGLYDGTLPPAPALILAFFSKYPFLDYSYFDSLKKILFMSRANPPPVGAYLNPKPVLLMTT